MKHITPRILVPVIALSFCPHLAAAQAPGVPPPPVTPAERKPDAPSDAPSKPTGKPSAKPAAAVPATTPEVHEGTQKRIERFNAISKEGKAELVFLGDSITESWEGGGKDVWGKYYAGRNAANFGISGDRTEHVLWRLDHGNFDGLSPKLIVIMIGTNNTGHRQDPAADTAAGIKAILDKLASKCPKSKVLLLAIFPRGEKGDDGARTINDGVNLIIKGYADNKRVFYRDIASQFMDGKGVVNKELMPDLLHLTARGYQLWAEAIEGDVAKLMGEKAKPAKAPEPEPKPAEATPKPK